MPLKDHPVTWITDNSPESRRFYEKKVPVENTRDPDALRAALKDEDYRIRVLAVENKYFPLSLYRLALRDKNGFVRSAVARKENLPKDLFVVALKDEDQKVARAAMLNDNFPEDLFALVLKRDSSLIIEGIQDEKIPANLVPTAFKHKNEYVRMAAVKHPDFPDSLLEKALKDESEGVRNVAYNVSRRKQIKGNQTVSIEQKIEAARVRVESAPKRLTDDLKIVKLNLIARGVSAKKYGMNMGNSVYAFKVVIDPKDGPVLLFGTFEGGYTEALSSLKFGQYTRKEWNSTFRDLWSRAKTSLLEFIPCQDGSVFFYVYGD